MKTKISILSGFLIVFGLLLVGTACNKDEKTEEPPPVQNQMMSFSSSQIAVTFSDDKKSTKEDGMVRQTPSEYIVALKSATLVGQSGTSDFELFDMESLENSIVFDFINDEVRHNLSEDDIPEGSYKSIRMELYYLQMRLPIATANRGVEQRNMRIYFSDDGVHRPGDVTQINEQGVEIGWLFATNLCPDFDPVTPRYTAYTLHGVYIPFADKDAEFYGPFGSMSFWENNDSQPFIEESKFYFGESNNKDLVVDFNVFECWQFEDKTGDGYFGMDDIVYDDNPTAWAMIFPKITVNVE